MSKNKPAVKQDRELTQEEMRAHILKMLPGLEERIEARLAAHGEWWRMFCAKEQWKKRVLVATEGLYESLALSKV